MVIEPGGSEEYEIVQEIYEIDQGATLELDLQQADYFYDGSLVISVMPYPTNFKEISGWSMVRKGDKHVEFNAELLDKLTARVVASGHDPKYAHGGSLIAIREEISTVRACSSVNV